MIGADSPRDSARRFASMCAALSHPFTDRRVVLDDAGLDDAAWDALRAEWQRRLAADRIDAAEYAEAYRAGRKAIEAGADPHEIARGPMAQETPTAAAIVAAAARDAADDVPVRIDVLSQAAVEQPVGAPPVAAPPVAAPAIARQNQRTMPLSAWTAPGADDTGLPFEPSQPQQRPAPSAPLPPHDALGRTAPVDSIAIDDPVPFGRGAIDEPVFEAAPFTLRQLAAIHVEIELAPDREAEVLETYRLSRETKKRLDAELASRLERDAAVRAAFGEACREYRSWRRTHGPQR